MQLSKRQHEPYQLPIKIQVDATAYQKFMCWVDLAKGEVSALGLVEEIRDADNIALAGLLITDFFLVKQTCSADETTMDQLAISELMLELDAKGTDSSKLRCWIHSHGSMSVFWSSTDEACIAGLANGEWLLSLVVNKRRDSIMRLDQYHPCHMYLSDVVWEVKYPQVEGLAEACFVDFKAKVTEHTGIWAPKRHSGLDHVADLKSAHARGSLTDEELLEEMSWTGLTMDELDEFQPY